MAYDEGIATILREALEDLPGLAERRMFGGLAFLQHGNMVCGAYRDRAMFRVGRDRVAEALALPGTAPMQFTGRPMRGIVEAVPDTIADDAMLARLVAMARDYVATLPPK